MIKVRVPATSANLGPGFDCMGWAIGLYSYIEIEQIDSETEIIQEGKYKRNIPPENNLIYKAIKEVFKKCSVPMPNLRIKVDTEIPASRGLGSSAACIVGGLVSANALIGELGPRDILSLACAMETHPDNVAPCFMGSMVLSSYDGEKLITNKIKCPDDICLAIMYPDSTIGTKKSRVGLPQRISRYDAVYNIANSSLLVSAILQKKYDLLSQAMKDRLHQPYRKKMIEKADEIFKLYDSVGAYGSYISGSGPTQAAVIPSDKKEYIEEKLKAWANENNYNSMVVPFDNRGAIVTKL